ncbi:hypothetical protein UA18_03201 [Burkholderia multivorans]|uniref:Uncharacterized protein n=1 Tax=Burkholderia multivorans TaxID=87883 RepID=A0ABD7LMM2_9BURK|nr:hypothetical protein UA18_03201 [Burkholderia multivorans]
MPARGPSRALAVQLKHGAAVDAGACEIHLIDLNAWFPAGQRHDGRGHHTHAHERIDGAVDQLGKQRPVVAAHDARAQRREQNVGGGLFDVRLIRDRAAGACVHADHPCPFDVVPPIEST